MIAFAASFSGLRTLADRCGQWLGTKNFSSISHALRRPSSVEFVRRLVEALQVSHRPIETHLVAIDGMAISMARTQRHSCAPMNNNTAGGGVIWAFVINAVRGLCPVKVLKVIQGAWQDSARMMDVELIANGPVYLMDRGFYKFKLLSKWLDEKVHFIVRARDHDLKFEVLKTNDLPRTAGGLKIVLDAFVSLGSPTAVCHPRVRLIRAILPTGQMLSVVSDQLDWPAEKILDSYKQRWHIERFHRFVKEAIGLAHLYSFGQNGIEFLLYTALLLALLLYLSQKHPCGKTVVLMRNLLRDLKRLLGLSTHWKRNSCQTQNKRKRNPKNL